MKKLLCALVVCAAVAVQAQPSPNTLEIVEENDSLSAWFNGSPVMIDVTGPVNAWTIELPALFNLNSIGLVYVGEPESGALMNIVNVGTQPQFLIWESDEDIVGGPFPTSVTLIDAGTLSQGGEFNLVLTDRQGAAVPDAGTTGMLLGLAMAGMGSMRLLRRQRK